MQSSKSFNFLTIQLHRTEQKRMVKDGVVSL
jgi:hypothetical protein